MTNRIKTTLWLIAQNRAERLKIFKMANGIGSPSASVSDNAVNNKERK